MFAKYILYILVMILGLVACTGNIKPDPERTKIVKEFLDKHAYTDEELNETKKILNNQNNSNHGEKITTSIETSPNGQKRYKFTKKPTLAVKKIPNNQSNYKSGFISLSNPDEVESEKEDSPKREPSSLKKTSHEKRWFPSKSAVNCLQFTPSKSRISSFVGRIKNNCPYNLVMKQARKGKYTRRFIRHGKIVYNFPGIGLGTINAFQEKNLPILNGNEVIYIACRREGDSYRYVPMFTNKSGTKYSCYY